MTKSMLVALVALVPALGGTATAASGLIGSAQIKNGSIRLVDISPSAKVALRGQRGPAGPQGPQGIQGATGLTGAQGAPGLWNRAREVVGAAQARRSDNGVAPPLHLVPRDVLLRES
jgi:hypothetical protein